MGIFRRRDSDNGKNGHDEDAAAPWIKVQIRGSLQDSGLAINSGLGRQALGCIATGFDFNSGVSNRYSFEAKGCNPDACGALKKGACHLVGQTVDLERKYGEYTVISGGTERTFTESTTTHVEVLGHSSFRPEN
jgi:hypothetical protein